MEFTKENFELLQQENSLLKADLKELKQTTFSVLQIFGLVDATGGFTKFSKMKLIKTVTTSIARLFDGDNFLQQPINVFINLYEKYKHL